VYRQYTTPHLRVEKDKKILKKRERRMSSDLNTSSAKRRRRSSPESPESTTSQSITSTTQTTSNVPPAAVAQAAPISNAPSAQPSSATTFRSVTACNRCRLRKNRCDQRIPACTQCEKAGVKCVGYDPITKREIPRRSVCLSIYSSVAEEQKPQQRSRKQQQ